MTEADTFWARSSSRGGNPHARVQKRSCQYLTIHFTVLPDRM